ncbi:MAG: hypothetical protein JOZ90_01865 [Alphaproteobacteria bacterium]|nr:hypothetical protein [Alphaproteobacteria bacterium]MBV9370751.1 hypothetical protein [Alphaproteobacteria bacterium]MBV9899824.1 hypothetical protein [Alphaproteobacteria bacterium]
MAQWLGSPTAYYRSSDSSMTYTDFLQQRELNRELATWVSAPVKSMITTTNEASGAQIRQLERLEEAHREATHEIVWSISDLKKATEDGFSRVGSVLEWGFARVAAELGRTNDHLEKIENLIENPSLTWAYEQFSRARDRLRRGHFAEALDAVDKAINGYGSELGENTEHRFHFLRGVVLLGDSLNNSPDVIDLSAAESAFLASSRYAAHDFPEESANGQLYAAYAANCQGKYTEAAAYARKGLTLHETAGLHYELARAFCALRDLEGAAYHLKWSIRLDRNLLTKAPGDPAFILQTDFVEKVFSELLQEIKEIAFGAHPLIKAEADRMSALYYYSNTFDVSYGANSSDSTAINAARSLARRLEESADFGIDDIRIVLEEIPNLWMDLGNWNAKFVENAKVFLSSLLQDRRAAAGEMRDPPPASENLPFGVGIAVAALTLLYACTNFGHNSGSSDILEELISTLGTPIIFGFIAAGITYFVVAQGRESVVQNVRQARESLSNLSTAAAHEQSSLGSAVLYSPSRAVFDVVPGWALGFKPSASTDATAPHPPG